MFDSDPEPVRCDPADPVHAKETGPFVFPTAYGMIVTRGVSPLFSRLDASAARFPGSGSNAKACANRLSQCLLKLRTESPSKAPQSTKTSSLSGVSRSNGKYVSLASSAGDNIE